MRLQFRKQSASELVSCNETQTLKVRRIKVCKSNYPIVMLLEIIPPQAEGKYARGNETQISESQVLEAKRTKICWTNYPPERSEWGLWG